MTATWISPEKAMELLGIKERRFLYLLKSPNCAIETRIVGRARNGKARREVLLESLPPDARRRYRRPVKFVTREDLDRVVEELLRFAEDGTCVRLFELSRSGESNLFHIDTDRSYDVARLIEPSLNETPDLDTILHQLNETDNETQERLLEIIMDLRTAFYVLGMFAGAAWADPSGTATKRLGSGWSRFTAAQPRHHSLK